MAKYYENINAFGIIRHISESEILKSIVEAQQSTLEGSCEPLKAVLSINTSIVLHPEISQYGLQKPNGRHRGHVAGLKVPRIIYANGGRF